MRGRVDAEELKIGEHIDFWLVEAYEPDAQLCLVAEMKLLGTAWLQFDVEKDGDETVVCQTARFESKGVLGRLYWYLLYPLHKIVWAGLFRAILARAEAVPTEV